MASRLILLIGWAFLLLASLAVPLAAGEKDLPRAPKHRDLVRTADRRGIVHTVAFSPDSKRVAAFCTTPSIEIEIWKVDTLERIQTLSFRGPPRNYIFVQGGFTSAGRLLVAATYGDLVSDRSFDLLECDLKTGKQEWLRSYGPGVVCEAIWPERGTLVIRCADPDNAGGPPVLRFIDLKGKKKDVSVHSQKDFRIRHFSQDRTVLVREVGKPKRPEMIEVVEIATDKVLGRIAVPEPGLESCVLSGDKKLLLIVPSPGLKGWPVLLSDVVTGKEIQAFPQRAYTEKVFDLAPDGHTCVVTSFGMRFFDFRTRQFVEMAYWAGVGYRTRSVAYSPDGKTFVCGEDRGAIEFFDAPVFKSK